MAKLCGSCGREVEFRYIDGRVTPLGCACYGGFGSYGYGSRPVRNQIVRPRVRTIHRLRETDGFYRPSKCPVCRATVFFVRHNGGSVWFDKLGWPWPKHGCFELPGPRRQHERIERFSKEYASLQLGMVIEVEDAPGTHQGRVTLRCSTGVLRRVSVRAVDSVRPLLGELVAYTWDDHRLFRLTTNDRDYLAFDPLLEDPSEFTAMTQRVVQHDTHNDGLRDGDIVQHHTFGVGTVMAISGSESSLLAQVQFETAGLRKLAVKDANLLLLERA